ncbi:MAG: endo-1,4-beta-xylanase [Planctomycetota bacterium]
MKFKVFKNGKIVDKLNLVGAYLFGSDGITVRKAQISFNKGVIYCKKSTLQTAGLALLWPVEDFGKVMLPTTALPERERPYILNIELARAKLMQIMNKKEEWALFNEVDKQAKVFKQAQDLFIQAIQNLSDEKQAAKLADEALKKAIIVAENMANTQADVMFEARSKSHGFGRGCLGCIVDPKQTSNSQYLKSILSLSGFATVPMNWALIEKQKGSYDFTQIDESIKILGQKRLVIGAGPLLYFSKKSIPQWLIKNRPGFEKVREAAYRFISKVVSRYSGTVRAWRVISGLNAFNHFNFSFDQVLEMTRAANMAVKAEGDRALKIIDVCNPWGEYYASVPNTISPFVYVDMVVQSGINFDVFGLQMRVGKNLSGMHIRDMMQISSLLDLFALVGKPVHITEVEAPSKNFEKAKDGDEAGVWHHDWDESLQAQWIEQFYKIVLSKPFVDTITYSHLTDDEGNTIQNSGLLTNDLKPKKSFEVLKKMRAYIYGG